MITLLNKNTFFIQMINKISNIYIILGNTADIQVWSTNFMDSSENKIQNKIKKRIY